MRRSSFPQMTREHLKCAQLSPVRGEVTFGEAEDADVRITDIDDSGPVRFTVQAGGKSATAQLSVYGRHNAINATGAVAVLLELGAELTEATAAVAQFGGTKRRFEFHAEIGWSSRLRRLRSPPNRG